MAKKSKTYHPWTISILALLFIILVVVLFGPPAKAMLKALRAGPGSSWLNKFPWEPETNNEIKEMTREAPVKFTFSPKSIYLKEGKTIDVDLILVSKKEIRLDGADIILTFDPKILEVTQIIPGKVFSSVSQKREKEREGRVAITFLDEKTNGVLVKDEVKLATLVVKGRDFGNGALSVLSSDEGPTTVIAESGTSRKIVFDRESLTVVVY